MDQSNGSEYNMCLCGILSEDVDGPSGDDDQDDNMDFGQAK